MKKVILAISIAMTSCILAFGQSDDYKKFEVFGGYSYGHIDTGADSDGEFGGIDRREPFHGWEASPVFNLNRYFGIKGDISGAYNKRDFNFAVTTIPPTNGNISYQASTSLYNFLGGIQVKDNATKTRFKPFAHALVGVGLARVSVKNVSCTTGIDCSGIAGSDSDSGLAGAFGGGLDIKVNNRIDFRAFQVDYNPIRFDNQIQHNFRFGIGIVFK